MISSTNCTIQNCTNFDDFIYVVPYVSLTLNLLFISFTLYVSVKARSLVNAAATVVLAHQLSTNIPQVAAASLILCPNATGCHFGVAHSTLDVFLHIGLLITQCFILIIILARFLAVRSFK